ncbi:DUF6020 family protein [Paenibacillus hunanensis]|uniref:DUF6020 family protein n=1 Tax=Paenibacillus hunanensis TaxID=539262 RepID=UPI00202656C4|nr:DUF6020 family protein [Paenibacillus hunanensis]MCL9662829.1 DUF6020 family protein [Paenibacillus hunanensis]
MRKYYINIFSFFIVLGAVFYVLKLQPNIRIMSLTYIVTFGLMLIGGTILCSLFFKRLFKYLRTVNVKNKSILLIIILIAYSITLINSSSLWSASYHQIVITATGEKSGDSKGSEVWITGITVDDQMLDLSAVSFDNTEWAIKDGKIVSYSDLAPQPASTTLTLQGNHISIQFLKHQWSGKVEVTADNQKNSYDLYSATPSSIESNLSFKPSFNLMGLLILTCVFLLIISIILCVFFEMLNYNRYNTVENAKKWFWIYFASIFMVYFISYLAMFPGNMTPDSLVQWNQKTFWQFTDHHPIYSTLYVAVLTAFWNSPGAVSLFQVIVFSACISIILCKFNKMGISPRINLCIALLYAISPLNLLMVNTLWKDVPYALSILFFVFILILMIENTMWLTLKKNQAIFLSIVICIGLLKHEGIFVIACSMAVIALILRDQRKKLIFLGVISICAIFILNIGAKQILDVAPKPPWMAYTLPLQQVKELYIEAPNNFTSEQRNILSQIFNGDNIVTPARVDLNLNIPFTAVQNNFNPDNFQKNKKEFLSIWMDQLQKHPKAILSVWSKQTSIIWKIERSPEDAMYVGDMGFLLENNLGLKSSYVLPAVQSFIEKEWKELIANDKISWIFVRPAFYLYLSIVFCFIGFLKNGLKAWVLIVPIIVIVGGLSLTIQAQDTRYLYSVFLISPILFLYALKRGSKSSE